MHLRVLGSVRARRSPAAWLVAAAVALGGASTACARRGAPEPRLAVTWTLSPERPLAGPAALTLTVRDPAGRPVKGAKVRLEALMSHPGMAPVVADAAERAPGVYEASFAFTMQGDWVLLVSIAAPDGARTERRIDVPNVRPGR